jgi:hypothetical protein
MLAVVRDGRLRPVSQPLQGLAGSTPLLFVDLRTFVPVRLGNRSSQFSNGQPKLSPRLTQFHPYVITGSAIPTHKAEGRGLRALLIGLPKRSHPKSG